MNGKNRKTCWANKICAAYVEPKMDSEFWVSVLASRWWGSTAIEARKMTTA